MLISLILLWQQISFSNAACCAPGGVWSEWTIADSTGCFDFCGGAGTMKRTRTCLSQDANCPCVGAAEETTSCDTQPCYFPRNFTCAPGKTLRLFDSKLRCVLPNEIVPVTVPGNAFCFGCCPAGGIWGEWTDSGSCSDTCGACGRITRVRTCLSEKFSCQCVGATTEQQPCNRVPCTGRATECCAPATKLIVGGVPSCIENTPSAPAATAECCFDTFGLWNDWTAWSTCSTCGLCGTQKRTRTCASEPHGCPCFGPAIETQLCGSNACSGATPCCGSAVKYVTYDGAAICLPQKPLAVGAGVWSPWTTVTGKTCNDTCGAYGRIAQSRTCLPLGSTCTGDYFAMNPCGMDVCLSPRQSCATGFKKVIDQAKNTFQCAPVA